MKTARLTALVPAAHDELVQYRSLLPPGRAIVMKELATFAREAG